MPVDFLDYAQHGALVGQNFDCVKMPGLDLSGIDLHNCSFRGADLTDCKFNGAKLLRCDFSRADLTWVDFTGATLSNSDFTGSHARGMVMVRTKVINGIIRRVTWKQSIFAYADLNGCELLQNDFLGSRWYKCVGLDNTRYAKTSIFCWYRKPTADVPPVYEPEPGYVKIESSATGGLSVPENMGGVKAERDEVVAVAA